MKNNCEHNNGIYSRGNTWFCSECNGTVPEPEIPKSVQERIDDWYDLSNEEQCKKYNLPWDGQEFVRTFERLGFWKSVNKYGFKRTYSAFYQ